MDNLSNNFCLTYYLDFEDYYEKVKCNNLYEQKNGSFFVKIDKIYQFNNFFNPKSVFVPVVNFQIALHFVNQYITYNDPVYLHKVEFLVDSFMRYAVVDSEFIYFYHDYHQPLYMLKSGWVSGMAQGLFISLCVRLFLITNDLKYSSLASKAYNVMELPVSEGGCKVNVDSASWYEEYPSTTNSLVLNGNIFSIFALNDYNQIFDIQPTLDEAIKSLFVQLPFYFRGSCCRYDLKYAICDESYIDLHLRQFVVLKESFKINEIEEFIEKTKKCIPSCSEFNYFNKFRRFFHRLNKIRFILKICISKLFSFCCS